MMVRTQTQHAFVCVCGLLVGAACSLSAANPLSLWRDELLVQWRASLVSTKEGSPSIWTGYAADFFPGPFVDPEEALAIAERFPRDAALQLAAAEAMAYPDQTAGYPLDSPRTVGRTVVYDGRAVDAQFRRAAMAAPDEPAPIARRLVWVLHSIRLETQHEPMLSIGAAKSEVTVWSGNFEALQGMVTRGLELAPENALFRMVQLALSLRAADDQRVARDAEAVAVGARWQLYTAESMRAHIQMARQLGLPAMEAEWVARKQAVNAQRAAWGFCEAFVRMTTAMSQTAAENSEGEAAVRWLRASFAVAPMLRQGATEIPDLTASNVCHSTMLSFFRPTPKELAECLALKPAHTDTAQSRNECVHSIEERKCLDWLSRQTGRDGLEPFRTELRRAQATRTALTRRDRDEAIHSVMRRLAVWRFWGTVVLAQCLLFAVGMLWESLRRRRAAEPVAWEHCLLSWFLLTAAVPLIAAALLSARDRNWWGSPSPPTTSHAYHEIHALTAICFVVASVFAYRTCVAVIRWQTRLRQPSHATGRRSVARPVRCAFALSTLLWLTFVTIATPPRAQLAAALHERVLHGAAAALLRSIDEEERRIEEHLRSLPVRWQKSKSPTLRHLPAPSAAQPASTSVRSQQSKVERTGARRPREQCTVQTS